MITKKKSTIALLQSKAKPVKNNVGIDLILQMGSFSIAFLNHIGVILFIVYKTFLTKQPNNQLD